MAAVSVLSWLFFFWSASFSNFHFIFLTELASAVSSHVVDDIVELQPFAFFYFFKSHQNGRCNKCTSVSHLYPHCQDENFSEHILAASLLPSTSAAATSVLDATDSVASPRPRASVSTSCVYSVLPAALNAVGLLSTFAQRVGAMSLEVLIDRHCAALSFLFMAMPSDFCRCYRFIC